MKSMVQFGWLIVLASLVFFTPAPIAAQGAKDSLPIEILPETNPTDVMSIVFSPDGTHVLAGGLTVTLWDAASSRMLRSFNGKDQVAFSPDGMRIVSGGETGVELRDATTGKLLRTFEGQSPVTFSPDGTRILSAGVAADSRALKLWDAQTGALLRTFSGHQFKANAVAFSPDGARMLSGSGKTVNLWDTATGQLLHTLVGHLEVPFGVTSVAFSPDGARALSGSWDKTVKLWDAATGRLLRTFSGHTDKVRSVAFSPDGTRVLSGSEDKTIRLWDAATGQLSRTFSGHTDNVFSVAFSRDGTRIASGGVAGIKLWDAASGQLLTTFGERLDFVGHAAFSPNGTRLVSQRGETIRLWDATIGQVLRTFTGHSGIASAVTFSPDGTHLLSGSLDKTVKLWDVTTGQLRTFQGHSDSVTSVAFSPDGARVLSGSSDKTVKLWDATTGQVLRTFAGTDQIYSVAFSPDGTRVLSGSEDKSAKLWDAATGRLLRTFIGHSDSVYSVTFSPDGTRVLSGSWDKTLKLWDAASGQLLRTFTGHSRHVNAVAFSPDGARVLSASWDHTAKLWNAETGQLVRTFTGHSDGVYSVAFSADGTRVLSTSHDKTAKVWNLNTGEVLVTLINGKDGEWLAMTPEGFFVASKKGADLLSVVRGFEVYSIEQLFQALYRPDLVREKLAGDPKGLVREAAGKLDLDKVITSGNAPMVRFASPKDGQRIAAEEITAEAEIIDRGGGIGRVEWRINGVTLGVETRGLGRAADADKVVTVRQALTLDDGENTIEVVAYNAKSLIASVPAVLKVNRGGAQVAFQPRLYALTVGVNEYYDSRLRLTYASPDATALAEALQRVGEKIYERIELKTVLDADVNTANLDKVFGELSQRVRAQDVFVFFIAGHGKTVDGRYYFLPQDFRYQGEDSIVQRGIGQERWQEWFARIRARKSILLYDTCESGTLTGDRVAQRGLERVAALDRLTQAMGRTVLTASTDDAPALEGYRGHGVFTYALLDAFGRADTNRDGLIEVTGLAAYVDRQVPELSFEAFHVRQIPQMRIVGSNFPLANRIVVLPSAGEASAPVIPTKPTHVVPTAADVFSDAVPGSAPIRKLNAGTLVTLVKTGSGWTLIAREGKLLGYVATTDLVPIQ
jgi:WD40 repeat protein